MPIKLWGKTMKKTQLMLLAAATLVSGGAFASAATDAMTDIGTEAAALAAAAWPIVVSVVIAFIGMKLFKKFANKST